MVSTQKRGHHTTQQRTQIKLFQTRGSTNSSKSRVKPRLYQPTREVLGVAAEKWCFMGDKGGPPSKSTSRSKKCCPEWRASSQEPQPSGTCQEYRLHGQGPDKVDQWRHSSSSPSAAAGLSLGRSTCHQPVDNKKLQASMSGR